MRVLQLEKLAENTETVGLILEEQEVVESIEIVENYNKKLKQNECNNSEANKNAQSKLSGALGEINLAWSVVETAKENIELKFYYEEKSNCTSDVKFNATATKEKGRALTNEYRRVRNYLAAYKEDAQQHIIVLQSSLKDIRTEKGSHAE
jgi:predicted transposase YbfD/YdcC